MTDQAVWRRACPDGQVLDLLHARVTEPYAPHVHEEYAVGACTAGREVIRYRGPDQVVPAGGRGHPGRVPQQRSRQDPAVPVMLEARPPGVARRDWGPTSVECEVR
jgi:hypothetical protein